MLGIKTRFTESETRTVSLQETIVNLAHENELLKRRIYGNKTEKLRTRENQLALGNLLNDEKQLQAQLAEAVAKAKPEADTALPPPPAVEPKAKPKGRRDLALSDLPKVLIGIRDQALEKTAKHIGWEVSHQLMYERGGFSVLVKRVAKYEVPSEKGPTVVSMRQPETLFPRGLLHSSVVAYILVQKFGLGVPHYRLEQHIEDQGVSLDRVSRHVATVRSRTNIANSASFMRHGGRGSSRRCGVCTAPARRRLSTTRARSRAY